MADTATSLLSTVFHPVRAIAPQSLARWSDATEVLPLIDLPCHGDAFAASELYAGRFTFAGLTVEATPATIFKEAAPSLDWQDGLHSLFWLQHFRASGKVIHARMAARLLDIWYGQCHVPRNAASAAEALLNASIHGPHVIDQTLPQAKANFQNQLRLSLRNLSRLKPRGPIEALQKASAILAGQIVAEAADGVLRSAVVELSNRANSVFDDEGAHVSGDPLVGLATLEVIIGLLQALQPRSVVEPEQLQHILVRAAAHLTMRLTPHGALAFVANSQEAGERLKKIGAIRSNLLGPEKPNATLFQNNGFARLSFDASIIFVKFCDPAEKELDLAIEIWRKGEMCFSLIDQRVDDVIWKPTLASLYSTLSGALFALPCYTEQGARRALSIFLSGDGTDLRIENECAFHDTATELVILPADSGKLSPQQNGRGAVISAGRQQSWQMTSRGITLMSETHRLRLQQQPLEPKMNIAFRVAVPPKRQSRAAEIGTLL